MVNLYITVYFETPSRSLKPHVPLTTSLISLRRVFFSLRLRKCLLLWPLHLRFTIRKLFSFFLSCLGRLMSRSLAWVLLSLALLSQRGMSSLFSDSWSPLNRHWLRSLHGGKERPPTRARDVDLLISLSRSLMRPSMVLLHSPEGPVAAQALGNSSSPRVLACSEFRRRLHP